ncbi:unnamed protein product, partial [Closterium sp. Naga37s-1]
MNVLPCRSPIPSSPLPLVRRRLSLLPATASPSHPAVSSPSHPAVASLSHPAVASPLHPAVASPPHPASPPPSHPAVASPSHPAVASPLTAVASPSHLAVAADDSCTSASWRASARWFLRRRDSEKRARGEEEGEGEGSKKLKAEEAAAVADGDEPAAAAAAAAAADGSEASAKPAGTSSLVESALEPAFVMMEVGGAAPCIAPSLFSSYWFPPLLDGGRGARAVVSDGGRGARAALLRHVVHDRSGLRGQATVAAAVPLIALSLLLTHRSPISLSSQADLWRARDRSPVESERQEVVVEVHDGPVESDRQEVVVEVHDRSGCRGQLTYLTPVPHACAPLPALLFSLSLPSSPVESDRQEVVVEVHDRSGLRGQATVPAATLVDEGVVNGESDKGWKGGVLKGGRVNDRAKGVSDNGLVGVSSGLNGWVASNRPRALLPGESHVSLSPSPLDFLPPLISYPPSPITPLSPPAVYRAQPSQRPGAHVSLSQRCHWLAVRDTCQQEVARVQIAVSLVPCARDYGTQCQPITESAAYDWVLAAAMAAQGFHARNLRLSGPWEWLCDQFATCYGVSTHYTKLRYLTRVMDVATPTADCLTLIHQLLAPVLHAHDSDGSSVTKQEARMLADMEECVGDLLQLTFENYKSLSESAPSGIADSSRSAAHLCASLGRSLVGAEAAALVAPAIPPAVHLFGLLNDLLLPEVQQQFCEYLQDGGASVCVACGGRCRGDIGIHDQHILPSFVGLPTHPSRQLACTWWSKERAGSACLNKLALPFPSSLLPPTSQLRGPTYPPEPTAGVYMVEQRKGWLGVLEQAGASLPFFPSPPHLPASWAYLPTRADSWRHPLPHVKNLLHATADVEDRLMLWGVGKVPGGLDARELFGVYVEAWIRERSNTLMDVCRAPKWAVLASCCQKLAYSAHSHYSRNFGQSFLGVLADDSVLTPSPPPHPPRAHCPLCLTDFGQSFLGLLADDSGAVRALWGSFSTFVRRCLPPSSLFYSLLSFFLALLFSPLVHRIPSPSCSPSLSFLTFFFLPPIIKAQEEGDKAGEHQQQQQHQEEEAGADNSLLMNGRLWAMPRMRVLEAELAPMLLSKARSFGLSEQWVHVLAPSAVMLFPSFPPPVPTFSLTLFIPLNPISPSHILVPSRMQVHVPSSVMVDGVHAQHYFECTCRRHTFSARRNIVRGCLSSPPTCCGRLSSPPTCCGRLSSPPTCCGRLSSPPTCCGRLSSPPTCCGRLSSPPTCCGRLSSPPPAAAASPPPPPAAAASPPPPPAAAASPPPPPAAAASPPPPPAAAASPPPPPAAAASPPPPPAAAASPPPPPAAAASPPPPPAAAASPPPPPAAAASPPRPPAAAASPPRPPAAAASPPRPPAAAASPATTAPFLFLTSCFSLVLLQASPRAHRSRAMDQGEKRKRLEESSLGDIDKDVIKDEMKTISKENLISMVFPWVMEHKLYLEEMENVVNADEASRKFHVLGVPNISADTLKKAFEKFGEVKFAGFVIESPSRHIPTGIIIFKSTRSACLALRCEEKMVIQNHDAYFYRPTIWEPMSMPDNENDGQTAPAAAQSAPAAGELAPVVEEPAPVVEELAPVAGHPAPVAGHLAPVAGQPAPVAMQPAPVAVQPAPVVGQPIPVAGHPAPVAGQPAPVAVQPAPVVGQPIPVAGHAATVAVQPALVAEQPAPVAGQPAPVVEELAPVAGHPAPVAVQPAPVVGQPIPVAGHAATVAVQPAPIAEQPAPVAGQPAPVAEQPAPVAGQPAAVAGQPASVAGQLAPIAEPAPAAAQFVPAVAQPAPAAAQPALAALSTRGGQPARGRQPASVELPTRRVYVQSLPFKLSKEQFQDIFQQYGEIEECDIINERGRATGYGFVKYRTLEEAMK